MNEVIFARLNAEIDIINCMEIAVVNIRHAPRSQRGWEESILVGIRTFLNLHMMS